MDLLLELLERKDVGVVIEVSYSLNATLNPSTNFKVRGQKGCCLKWEESEDIDWYSCC